MGAEGCVPVRWEGQAAQHRRTDLQNLGVRAGIWGVCANEGGLTSQGGVIEAV